MCKVVERQPNRHAGWEVNLEVLQKVHNEVNELDYDGWSENISLEEVERVILALANLGYLRLEHEDPDDIELEDFFNISSDE